MRKLGIGVLVLIVLIVVAMAIAPAFINVNQYHDKIQAELSKSLGRQVTVGDMKLSLFPPSIRVQNAVVAEDPKLNTGKPFAQAQTLYVSIKLLPLLRKDIQVRTLTVDRPQVELVRDASGVWNFSTIGGEKNNAGGSNQKFGLGKLNIKDGSVAITDLQKHQPRAVYDHVDLTLEDYAPGKAFTTSLAVHLPGQGAQLAKLDGKGGPINQTNPMDTPFDGELTLDQVSIAGAQKFLNSEALANSDASISGKANVKNSGGKIASKGSLKLDNTRIHGVEVGYPINVDYDVIDDIPNNAIQISQGTIKLGNTPISLNGSVNTRSTPALADVKLQATDVSIAEIAKLAGAFGVALNPGMQTSGRLNANIHIQGATNAPSMAGSLQARDVSVSGKSVPAPVKVPQIQISMTPQQIQSNDFTASSGNTNVNVRFTMTQYANPNPTIDATIRTANANIAELLNIAQAAGVSGTDGMSGSGSLNLDVHASGPLKHSENMTFVGTGGLQNVSLKTPQMTKPALVHTANMKFTQNSILLDGLQFTLGSTNANGSLSLRGFQAPLVQFGLNADKLDANELQAIFGGSQTTSPQNKASSQTSSAPPKNKNEPNIITKMTGGGAVSIGTVLYNQLQLQNAKANVKLDRGVITVNPIAALLYDGTANGNVAIDMRGQNTVYNVSLKTQKVQSDKLIASVSSVKDVLYGLLASNIQGSFASMPDNSDIAKTLNGRVSVNVSDGKLAKVDLLNQLSSIGKFQAAGQAAQGFTKLQQLTGDLDIKNGVATTNNLKALIDGGTVAASGVMNLVDQSVNMKMIAVLSKTYSQQVGGTNVGGLMTTALANKNGELVLPVLVTGTLQNMHFAPDLQAVAQMKMQNLLPSFGNPGQLSSGVLGALSGKDKGGVGGILDTLSGKAKPNQQYSGNQPPAASSNPDQQPQKQNDAINSIMDALGGKKKQQQQKQQ